MLSPGSENMGDGMDEDGRITLETDGALLLIGIDRPEKLNGFTPSMFEELAAAYERLDADPDIRVGVTYAHGPHFTAGLDLPKFADRFRSGADFAASDKAGVIDPFARFGRPRRKPLLCAVRGICFTAGIELMLAADIVIAAEDCRFAQLEPKRGIMAVGGATYRFIERAGWGNAMRLLLTGMEFDAREAYRLGLVQEIAPVDEDIDRAIELARVIADNAPLAIAATLANARTYVAHGEATAAADFASISRKLAMSEDFKEGVASFREKRPARFEGR